MALDAGTTSNRCILFDRAGKIVSLAQKEFTQYFPKTGMGICGWLINSGIAKNDTVNIEYPGIFIGKVVRVGDDHHFFVDIHDLAEWKQV